MHTRPNSRFFSVACLLFLGSIPATPAQKPVDSLSAPVPSQLLTAKKVFIGNAGEEPRNYTSADAKAQRNSGQAETYSLFYADLKNSGRFELVGAPSDADLILEVGLADQPNGSAEARFRLVIRDPKTYALLWTFFEGIPGANRPATYVKNFAQAMVALVADLYKLTSPTTASAAEKN